MSYKNKRKPSLLPVFIRIFTLSVLLYVCLFQPTVKSEVSQSANVGPSYSEDVRPVFIKRCAACHSTQKGLPDLLDYKTAYTLRERIRSRVKRFEMPYIGYLTASEKGTILQWTKEGRE